MKRIDKFFWLNGAIGALLFFYFVRKIQNHNSIDPANDPYGLMGAAYYGLGL